MNKQCSDGEVCIDGFCYPTETYCVSDQDCAPGCCCIVGSSINTDEMYVGHRGKPFLEVECSGVFRENSFPLTGIRIMGSSVIGSTFTYKCEPMAPPGGIYFKAFNIQLDSNWFKAGDTIQFGYPLTHYPKEPIFEAPCSGKFEDQRPDQQYYGLLADKPTTWSWQKYFTILKATGLTPRQSNPVLINP